MPIRPELLVRDPAGVPIPPSEITTRIQRTWPGERFDLRYLSASWAVIRGWGPQDQRWAGVQSGELSPHFTWDIIGFLPITCSVDEAPAFLEKMLREDSRDDIQKLALGIADWNAIGQPMQLASEVVDAVRTEMGKEDEIESAIYATTPAPSNRHKKRGRKTKDHFVPKG